MKLDRLITYIQPMTWLPMTSLETIQNLHYPVMVCYVVFGPNAKNTLRLPNALVCNSLKPNRKQKTYPVLFEIVQIPSSATVFQFLGAVLMQVNVWCIRKVAWSSWNCMREWKFNIQHSHLILNMVVCADCLTDSLWHDCSSRTKTSSSELSMSVVNFLFKPEVY